jgi:uncharacterized protein YbjQ (UPF0145 family)
MDKKGKAEVVVTHFYFFAEIPLSFIQPYGFWGVEKLGGIIITSSDKIPTKKIVKVLGNVFAERRMTWMWQRERPELCYEDLRKAADKMGADAVINVTYTPPGTFGVIASCHGIAIKVEEEIEDYLKCPNCEKKLPHSNFAYCPFCGKSLKL